MVDSPGLSMANIVLSMMEMSIYRKEEGMARSHVGFFIRLRHAIKLFCYCIGVGEVMRRCVIKIEERLKSRKLCKYGASMLQRVTQALSAEKVQHFAEFGTLLGIIREGKLLDHDTDMDFALPPDAAADIALESLLANGFNFYWGFEYDGQITEFTLVWEDIHVDFFLYFRDDEGCFYYQDYVDNYDKTHSRIVSWTPRRYKYPSLKGIAYRSVYGIEVPVPENYDEWLTAQYGNWRIPNKNWDYTKDANMARMRILTGKVKTVGLDRTLELLRRQ